MSKKIYIVKEDFFLNVIVCKYLVFDDRFFMNLFLVYLWLFLFCLLFRYI